MHDSILVIASYPPKGEKHSKAIVGGAMYAKNTLEYTMKAAQKNGVTPRITVLAEMLHDKKETYEEDGILIKRFWQRKSPTAFLRLYKEILRHKGTKTIVIEFELAMFGDNLSLIDFPLFLLLLKLHRKKIIFVFHQVLADIAEMSGHLNLPEKSVKTKLFNFLYTSLYTIILFLSSEAIVFEEVLKKRLQRLNRKKKITVIPFGTEFFTPRITKKAARETLQLPQDAFIVFSFGFIAWYKGTDWLVAEFSKIQEKHILLIIGGGPNQNHSKKAFYKRYIDDIMQKSRDAGIIVTGFIDEAMMPYYFEACDLVVLPYRTLMSSSGPLSLAYSFQKPVLLSEKMTPLFETADMKKILDEGIISQNDLTFQLNDTVCPRIIQLADKRTPLQKLEEFSTILGKNRSWEVVGKQYYDTFFNQ